MKFAKLSEVCDFQGGSQPPKSEFIFEPREGYVRLLQIRDFSRDDKAAYIPLDKARRFCVESDIMIGRYGASVGQIHRGKSGSYNVALIKTTPDLTELDEDYFYYYLTSPTFQKPLLNAADRSAQAGFSKKDIADFEVPIPSRDEQKRIVEVLRATFAKIDRLEKIAKHNITNEKLLIASILNDIFGTIGNGCDAQIAPLKELAVLKGRIGWKGLTAKEYTEKGPLFLSVHSLNYGDYVDFRDAFHISQERYDESPEIMLQKDDILICKDGAGIGKLAIMPELIAPTTINSSLLLIRHNKKLRAKYLYYCLLSPYFQNIVQSRLEGATTPHLYQRDIKDFPVHVTSLGEQDRIIQKLDLIFSKSQKYKKIMSLKLLSLAELRQSLLNRAFSGEMITMSEDIMASEIPPFSSNDNYTYHAGVIAYADSYFRSNAPDTFHGRTIFEKVVQAAETIAGIELGRQAVQGIRRPTDDKQRDTVEAIASEKGYFSFQSTGGKGMKLKRGRNFSELRLSFEENFQAKIPALDKFLQVIASMPTRDVEVLSTVHTAWNNYLIEKQTPTDEQIVDAAREGWHEEKTKIPRQKFFTAIKTLRECDLVPTGQGNYVGKIAGQSFDF